jgi:hypothetical protein
LTEQEALRSRIQADTEAYLSRGGKITTVDCTANKAAKDVFKLGRLGVPQYANKRNHHFAKGGKT